MGAGLSQKNGNAFFSSSSSQVSPLNISFLSINQSLWKYGSQKFVGNTFLYLGGGKLITV